MSTDNEEAEDSPIEQVRLTVPTTDDPTLPVFTFRALLLGLSSCVFLAACDNFFAYRQNPIYVTNQLVQLLSLPLGKLMAASLPSKPVRVPGTSWSFSLNPGPFNIKEHVLITILANGNDGSFAKKIIGAMKAYYHRPLNATAAYLLILTTKLMGYGFGGLFMKILVDSPYMWWPLVLIDVPFYRILHEKEARSKGQLTRIQFFILVFVSSFAYYVIPNYFFPSITALSFVCWIWKDSITAQQIGAGMKGLGIGSIALDWSTVTGYMGSPLAYPTFVLISFIFGFILITYIVTPIAYWTNSYNSKRFPIFSRDSFDDYGQPYNVSRVLHLERFEFDQKGYESYSKVNFSAVYVFSYGFSFAAFTASLSQTALFYGRSSWRQVRKALQNKSDIDIHGKLMKKYEPIPQYWFHTILLLMVGLAIITCEGFGKQLQLPYWGVILAVVLVFIFLIPLNVIPATTGQGVDLSLLTDLIIGYLYPGRPMSNMVFDAYSTSTFTTASLCIMDLKLGYYMKIPPRSMFLAQVIAAIFGATVSFGVTWWVFSSVKNICHPDLLPKGSPWTCPYGDVFSNDVLTWGIVGPSRMFFPSGAYKNMFLFFIIGAISPILVWFLTWKFPNKEWIKHINFPIIFIGASMIPLASPVSMWSWFVIGIIFNFFIFRKHKDWWGRYNYILSIALDIGVAMMALLTSLTLQLNDIYGVNWWGLEVSDHCPLASCPTAPNIEVEGCPIFH